MTNPRRIIDRTVWEYQYDGRAAFDEILEWCHTHIASECSFNGYETIWISTDRAAALFMLRWS